MSPCEMSLYYNSKLILIFQNILFILKYILYITLVNMVQDLKKRIILGLDVSTRCIGSTVASLDSDGTVKILEISHLRLKVPGRVKGMKSFYLKSDLFRQKLKEKYANYYISDVIIEEPLVSSNNAETAAILLRFNGMISQSVKEVLGVVPEYISSYDARKFGCPSLMAIRKYNKQGEPYSRKKIIKAIKDEDLVLFGAYPFDCAKKYILWNYVSEKFPGIQWEYNTKDELKNENFDASDSLMCVLGYVSKCRYGDEPPKIVSTKNGKDKIEYTVDFCGQLFDKTIEFED